jgi:hypothetical protein
MKRILPLLALLLASRATAQFVVIDPSVLAQAVKEVAVTLEQLQQLKTEVERLGDPAAVTLDVARLLQHQLAQPGVGRTLDEVQAAASGSASFDYDGNGLYHPPGAIIITADGRQTPRVVEEYRKFDAVTQARITLEDVMRDTEERRQYLRQQVEQTLGQLQTATTMAQVAKLTGMLLAENTELSAIDREREAPLSRLLAQHIENQTDAARQERARREERAADFRAASEKLAAFLTPDTTPVRVRDPRTQQP